MKKLLLAVAMASIGYSSSAQNVFPTPSGLVGIGTTSPIAPLDIKLTTNQHVQFVPHLNGGYPGFSGIVCINDANSGYTPLGFWASNYFLGGGNVGIGTTTPQNKLDVYGGITSNDVSTINGIKFNTVNTYNRQLRAEGYNLIIKSGDDNSSFLLPYANNAYARFQNYGLVVDGNVGIGTSVPDAKLAVNGTIHSSEVKVDLNVVGPDYVFKPDYQLMTLNEVKTFIDRYHHLPEIPSADQMAKDGLSLGDMNTKLLKKVEELTLYLIKLEKENKALKKGQQEIKSKLKRHHIN